MGKDKIWKHQKSEFMLPQIPNIMKQHLHYIKIKVIYAQKNQIILTKFWKIGIAYCPPSSSPCSPNQLLSHLRINSFDTDLRVFNSVCCYASFLFSPVLGSIDWCSVTEAEDLALFAFSLTDDPYQEPVQSSHSPGVILSSFWLIFMVCCSDCVHTIHS